MTRELSKLERMNLDFDHSVAKTPMDAIDDIRHAAADIYQQWGHSRGLMLRALLKGLNGHGSPADHVPEELKPKMVVAFMIVVVAMAIEQEQIGARG